MPSLAARPRLIRTQGKVPMRLFSIAFAFLLSSTLAAHGQVRAVVPAATSMHANRFCSPAVDAGDYVYISGQGPLRPDGSSPATFGAQVGQALDNIKAIVEAAGLTMDHVVYTQVYLEDLTKYDELNAVFAAYFPKAPPARAVLPWPGLRNHRLRLAPSPCAV